MTMQLTDPEPSWHRTTHSQLGSTLLHLLAVAGDSEPWSLVAAAQLQLGSSAAAGELKDLLASRTIIFRDGRLALRDDNLVRQLVARMSPNDVAQAHAAWSQVTAEDPLDSARHEALSYVDRGETASRASLSAAQRLQAAGRHHMAIELYTRAARLAPDRQQRVEALARGSACAYSAGMSDHGRDLASELRRLEPSADVHNMIVTLEVSFDGPSTGPYSFDEHVRSARVLVAWGQLAAAFMVLAAAPDGSCDDNLSSAAEAHRAGPEHRGLTGLSMFRSGGLAGSLPLLSAAGSQFDSLGEYGAAAAAYTTRAEAASILGHVNEAKSALEHSAHLCRTTGQSGWSERGALVLALLRSRQGSLTDTDEDLGRSMVSQCRRHQDLGRLVYAVHLLSTERWEDGFAVLARLITHAGRSIPELVSWGLLGHFADAASHVGREAEARVAVSSLAAIDGLLESDVMLAELLYATAALADSKHALTCFEVMLSHDPSRWPWLAARAHLAYGERLRRDRQVTGARPHLASARQLFAAMDVPALERRARTELRASGVPDSDALLPGATLPLSPQELEIARMAARGLTNREIGRALFVSPRTVGAHLYRIFPKLGITSRMQLGQLLAEH